MKFSDNTQWRWYAEKNIAYQQVRFYNVGTTPDGKMKHRAFETVKETVVDYGTSTIDTEAVTFAVDYDEAQQIMQELWECGVRPNGIESSNEYVQSLKDHIATLQNQVAHLQSLTTPVTLIADENLQKAFIPDPELLKKG